jgi:hypothetical protein
MPLPPYEPDGSLPTPLQDLTAKNLIERYGISKQTLYTRLSAICVTGSKRGKQVWFDSSDVFRLDAAHHYLGIGYGLKDLKEACGSFEVDAEEVDASSSVISPPSPPAAQNELVIAPAQERVVIALTTAVRHALEATQPAPMRDPLRSYRLLQEASDRKYQLTSQSLREILEVAQSTVNSWPGEISRNGFLLKRVGPGRWRVYQEEDVVD